MPQLLGIVDDKIVINKLSVNETDGNLTHTGTLTVTGALQADSLNVPGTIIADVIHAKKIVTANGSNQDPGQWAVNTEEELNGKGFSWTWGAGSANLSYRSGKRIWSNANIDLAVDKAYKIDNVDVLSASALGSTVTKSNLKQLGNLRSLTVDGHANIGGWAIFTESNRLGLNTETPNGALGIVDGDLEVIVAATAGNVANIGTYTNHDVAIISDNLPRVIVKKNGEVHIGDENFNNGVLKVHGIIEAESIVTDNRIERTSPLEFKASRTNSIYGLGLVWQGQDYTRQFIMRADPDRLWSSESIELNDNKGYFINGQCVLNGTSLGANVSQSSLTTLGTLQSLTVQGAASFLSEVSVQAVTAKSVDFNDGTNSLSLTKLGISVNKSLSVTVQGAEDLFINKDEIVLGNKSNTRRPVKVFGPLSVGVNNPDPSLSLAVSGDISFANRKFFTGNSFPVSGSFVKGDICWNTEPRAGSAIGWVCIVDGTPGEWLPFGTINNQ